MSSFQTALDRINKAASSAGIAVPQAAPTSQGAPSALDRIAAAAASVEPGAAPGEAASEQDLMGIAAQQYEDQLVLPKMPAFAKVATLGLEPREIERGLRTQIAQAAQAIATPGLRAQFIQSVLDPIAMMFTPGGSVLPAAAREMAAKGLSQMMEPSGSGLSVEDLRTELVAARGAAAGMAAGQEEGFAGDVARGIGQSIPQFLGVAGAIATGGVPVAAAVASQSMIPLSAYTGGQLAYMDELDAKRAQEALEGKPLSQFNLKDMRTRATASATIQTGVEVAGAALGARLIGKAAMGIAGSKPGRAVIQRLSEAGQPIVGKALASKAGQAGVQAFARATNGTGRITNGFFGQAGKIVSLSAAEEGAEELATAILESPFTEAPLSDDIKQGLYGAFVGAAAGGVGGAGAVGGAVARRAVVNRREAFRPENDAEIRLRQIHTDAQKARTNWTEDLDAAQQAEVSVVLNSLNGMAPEERGIFLRELADRRFDIQSHAESLLARRQELDAALAGAREAQRTYEAGAPERAAKETIVSEAQAAFDKAEADFRAAQELLAESEEEAQKRPRVARPGRVVVSTEQRQANVEAARAEVSAAQKRLEAAAQEAGVAEGLEIAPGMRIDPAGTIANIEADIRSVDDELRIAATDKLLADSTYNAVREKISDMPMEYRQQEPSAVLSGVGTSGGVELSEAKAPKKGGRITREMEALGVRVVWFRGKGRKFGSPAFHSMESRGVVYLNADADMSQVRAKAFHELFHDIQMFRPEIAQAYSDRVGLAPIYEAGAKYARGRAEGEAKARMDAVARIQAAAAGAGLAGVEAQVPEATARAGAARLQQEGEAEAFGATAARVTGRGLINPFVQFAARRGLMGRDVAAAMAVIDMASRAAAVERVSGVKPVATLSPLARTLLWAEDMAVDIPSEIKQATAPAPAPAAQPAAPGISMARPSDAEYLAAVERGDMTTAQRMVDEAAKAAGYFIRAKHGSTSPEIQAFDFSHSRKRFTGKSESGVVWFSDNDEVIRRYASTQGGIDVERVINELNEDMLSPARGGVSLRNEDGSYSKPYHTWSNVSDHLTVFYLPPESGYQPGYYAQTQATDSRPTNIGITPDEAIAGLRSWLNKQEGMKKPLTMSEVIYDSYLKLSNPLELDFNGQEKTEPWDDIVSKAIAGGHDGIIIKNVIDVPRGMFGSLPLPLDEYKGTVYGILSPEQAKSANPITSDEAGNVIPLSRRFDVSRPEISFARASDDEYFAAIERGDMPAVQRMVDAAAKAAGYIYRVFHGTNAPPFDVFDLEKGGEKTGAASARLGFFATDNPKVAQSYADNIGMGGLLGLMIGEGEESTTRDKALNTPKGMELSENLNNKRTNYNRAVEDKKNQIRQRVSNSDLINVFRGTKFEKDIEGFIDVSTRRELETTDWQDDPIIVAAANELDEARNELNRFVLNNIVDVMPNRRVLNLYAKIDNPAEYDAEGKTPADFALTPKIEKAMVDGNDGVIIRNLIDPVEPSTHYVVFDSSQFKSADPVTRDEAGNVIPLSRRFDVSRPEISFARSGEDAEVDSLRKQIADLQRQVRDVQNVTAAQRANALREVRILERRLVTAERIAGQKTLQATRAKMRLELEKQAAQEDIAAVERDMAKVTSKLDASQAAVRQMRTELASLRRGERLEERLAEAEETAQRAIDWAYAIGRNEGLLAGEVRGQQVKQREVRKLSTRLDIVQERLDKAIPALREARKQIKEDAAAAQRAIDFAYGMGLAKGRVQGVMEGRRQVLLRMARREDVLQNQLFNLRKMLEARADRAEDIRDAAQAIARDAARMLPEKLRGPLAVRIANVKTPAQANRVAVEAVKLAANAEVASSIDGIRRLRKQLNKRGMRYATRQRVEALLDEADAGLRTATGRRMRAVVTPSKGPQAGPVGPAIANAVDIYGAVVDAAAKVEQAAMLYKMDRDAYLVQRAQRIARYDALRTAMVQAMQGRPTLAERERADLPPRLSIARRLARANSDVYTLMLELEGNDAGVINELLSRAQAGKNEASLEHASILRQILPALEAAGYSSIPDYALKNGLLGQASAQVRTVQVGGEDVTVPVGTILSIAAMDDETFSLFPANAGERGQSIKFPGADTTREFFPTQQDITAIRNGLSAEERGLVDAMKNILETQVRDRVLETVFLVEGDMPPVVANYWPRVRETQMKADANVLQQTAGNLVRGALTSVGFAQARVGGKQPLLYSDAFQTWERHVQVSMDMIHMAQPYRDAATVLTDPAVVRGLDMQMGKGTAEGLLAIFSNGVGATARSNPTIIDKMTNNITGAILAMRPRTLAKVVIGGQIRLMSEIPAEYMARGVARSTKPRTPRSWNARVEEIHAVNGYFNRRHQLHMRSIISGSLSDGDRVRVGTAWQASIDSLRATGNNLAAAQLTEAFENLKDAGNGANLMIAAAVDALRYMDEQIMLTAVEARLAEVEDEGVLAGQDALREAASRAERDFRRTQNASDEFDDTFFAASARVKGQQGWRLLLPFTSDPLKARNQIRRAYLSGDRRLETAAAIGGNAAASTIIGAASLATVGYMVSLIAGLLGGDEPTDEEERKFAQEAKKIPANVASEVLSSTVGLPGIIMGQVVQGMQYRRPLFTPLVGRPIEQAGRELTADDLPVLVRILPATLALSQYLGFPMYGLYQFAKDFIPESEMTPQEKVQEKIKRRQERMTPEAVRKRIQQRVERMRQGR